MSRNIWLITSFENIFQNGGIYISLGGIHSGIPHSVNTVRARKIVHMGMEFKGLTPEKFKLGTMISDLVKRQVASGASMRMYLPRPRDIAENTLILSSDDVTVITEEKRKLKVSLVNTSESETGPGKLEVFLVEDEKLFGSYNLYSREEYWVVPWVVFPSAVLEHLKLTGFSPDIVHCHEWQTGLMPGYLKMQTGSTDFLLGKTKTVFTPHEPGNLGNFNVGQWKFVGLPGWQFTQYSMNLQDYYQNICLLKAGMHADLTLFDSKEQLDDVISGPNTPRAIVDFIKKMQVSKNVLYAQSKKPDSLTQEYFNGVTDAYGTLLKG
jgi:hypothetical protein